MSQFKAIIFDCGGVIFTYSFDNTFNYWATVTGKDVNEIKNRFDFDDTFRLFERGEIGSTVFRKHVLRKLKLHIDDENFDKGWNSIYSDLVPGIKQLLQELTRKYRLIALTNTNEIHEKKWRTTYAPIFGYFERVFCSHKIQVRKPEQKAYSTVLNYLRLKSYEVVFLDDKLEYVQAALKMGIKGIHIKSFRQMIEELTKLGIDIEGTV